MKISARLALAFLFFYCTCVRAQSVVDNFEDGNLENPAWFGDTEDFVVTDGRLRLMADGAGESRLSIDLPDNADGVDFTLDFLVDMDFAPSASNLTTLLLEECTGNDCVEKGFIKIGGISGSDDRVEVFIIDTDVVTELFGATGAVGSQPATVRFRLQTASGFATLSTNYDGGEELTTEATGQTQTARFNRFTILCEYTATRADKFSFDDFQYTIEEVVDNDPPVLLNAVVVDATTVRLVYDEAINATVANDPANYTISGTEVAVQSAAGNGSQVTLNLDGPLPANQNVTLTVEEAEDQSGNQSGPAAVELLFVLLNEPTAGNVLINEFLADPTPVIGLPNAEYVELYNPTDTAVDASLLAIASGGTAVSFPQGAVIPANGYLVVSGGEAAEFEALGAVVASLSLPSLTNGGDVITLLRGSEVLREITYTDAWYNDPGREDGGYSIEYTGAGADAGCSASWKASEDLSGGTPGRANSVTGRVVDVMPPVITGLNVTDGRVDVLFDEDLLAEQFEDGSLISIDNGAVVSATQLTGPNTVSVFTDLQEGVIYTLTILPDFSDCAGNFPAEALTVQLAIPGEPAAGDVIINELLFNPGSGGSDFVELYNCSDQVFQIEGWVLANTLSTSQTSAERTITATRLFLPGEYLTITADPGDLMTRYPGVDSSLLVENSLPSLPDDEGNLTVLANGAALDAFDYSEDLHSPLIGDEDGVSLERLRQKTTTQDDNNWFSAAQSEGFATPTRPNSQARDVLPEPAEQTFSLINTTFSPDGDSFEDLLELRYLTDRPGFLARIRIFDAQGRPVRTLRQVELLAGSGTIRWDGVDDDGQRARTGIYVLFVELFNPDGEVREEKLTAVLAGGR